jgi:hypothetical protein
MGVHAARAQRRPARRAGHQRDLALGRGAAHQHGHLAQAWVVDVHVVIVHCAFSLPLLFLSSIHHVSRHPPIEPAPMVITTSPSRAMAAMACGQIGHVLHEHRLDLARHAQRARQRAAVGGHDGRLAGGIDLGQQHGVGAAEHLDEVLEAVARAGVAVRLEGQHQAPAGEGAARGRQRGGHLHRVVAVVVDQR